MDNVKAMENSAFGHQLKQLEKHIDNRLDRIESALSILNTDNKRNSEKIAEHNIRIQQNKEDLDALGKISRDMHMNCSKDNDNMHQIIFTRVEKLENGFSFYKGAVFVMPFVVGIIYFFIGLWLNK